MLERNIFYQLIVARTSVLWYDDYNKLYFTVKSIILIYYEVQDRRILCGDINRKEYHTDERVEEAPYRNREIFRNSIK